MPVCFRSSLQPPWRMDGRNYEEVPALIPGEKLCFGPDGYRVKWSDLGCILAAECARLAPSKLLNC